MTGGTFAHVETYYTAHFWRGCPHRAGYSTSTIQVITATQSSWRCCACIWAS